MTYTMTERAVMIALMAHNREMANADLKKIYGLSLDPKQRDKLRADKRISLRVEKRQYSYTLEDAGWEWVTNELSTPLPKRAGPGGAGLYALMHGLAATLGHRRMTLAELFSYAPVNAQPQHPATVAANPEAIAKEIIDVYWKLAKRPGDLVYLSDLRPRLTLGTRDEVDAVLKQMFRDRKVSLGSRTDTQNLTHDQFEAAVRVGVTDRHYIFLE